MGCTFPALLLVLGQADDWTPPKNPDPSSILHEAHRDTRAGRYKTALAKHLWYHNNALSISPAQYGVRLSFALSYWHELAKKYPPAMDKLKEARDQAATKVKQGKDLRNSFHDMASINRKLGDFLLTKEAFETLDRDNPKSAKEVFDVAQSALVAAKAYELFGKYVDPEKDISRFVFLYRSQKQLAEKGRIGETLLKTAKQSFATQAATLVAVLVINKREEEAKKIAERAKKELEDESFQSLFDSALKGVVPKPR